MKTEVNSRPKSFVIWKVLKIIGWVILGIAGATLLAFLFGYVVMWLWNWLMPSIFGLIQITFWQAVGIIILARLIFGGFKHGPNHGPHHKFSSHWKSHCNKEKSKNGWHKWKFYDDFWKEEGEKAFDEYVEKKKTIKDDDPDK